MMPKRTGTAKARVSPWCLLGGNLTAPGVKRVSDGDLGVKTMGDERAWALLWFQFQMELSVGMATLKLLF